MDCVFCAIAERRLPAHRLYEDDDFIVLLDIFPMRPAHVLIVSRRHAPFLHDLPPALAERLLPLAERVAAALRQAGYGGQGINLLLNDGPDANQHVPHLHLHLIPRRPGDLPALLWRLLTRFLPLGRKRIEARLQDEADRLRLILAKEN
ncbi:Diadenosine tetraphosphate (Ap4A) hydrolase [Ectopseudomonas oleovorans]|uniref:Diadenosine tetraphosphate (Ap4A) hydrolase n=1 Tax=Ectopseudomonas oleovorans TaxID=301 RepID=A0A653BA05_ECTOL|nr:Diadenosine tetraphosphate (Ap4A) hydrolase [Pseudomonas oleovorans]